MAELTKQAGLAPPEFESHAGEVIVRFRPIRYAAPLRIGHNLSELQRQLLEALSILQAASLTDIIAHAQVIAAERTIRENLAFLRQLGLVESMGHGRGARWIMRNAEQ